MGKLFKCVITSSIRELPDRIDYLRCKSKKILEDMFKQCFNVKHSEYWGYCFVTISQMKFSNFPQVMTVNVKGCPAKMTEHGRDCNCKDCIVKSPTCPKCKTVLTSWNEKNWVCDYCGYGKDSNKQMAELQKIIGVKN